MIYKGFSQSQRRRVLSNKWNLVAPADHYQHEQMLIRIRGPATSSSSWRTVGGVERLPRFLKCAASKAFANERWKYFHVDLSSHRQINLVASGGVFSGWLSGLVSRCHRNNFRDRMNGWLGIDWSPLCHFWFDLKIFVNWNLFERVL